MKGKVRLAQILLLSAAVLLGTAACKNDPKITPEATDIATDALIVTPNPTDSAPSATPESTPEPTPEPTPVPEDGFRYNISDEEITVYNVNTGYSYVNVLFESDGKLSVINVPQSYEAYTLPLPEGEWKFSLCIKESEESEPVYTISGEKALQYALDKGIGTFTVTDDEHLGGSCAVKPETVAISGVYGTFSGNDISFVYGYSDSFDINGKVRLTGIEGGGEMIFYDNIPYLKVTDNNGNARTFRVSYQQKTYNLPVIYITTENGAAIDSTEYTVAGTVTIDYNGSEGSASFDSVSGATAQIRGRGHSSWKLAKKPYKIKFDEKASLFGLHKAKDWVLLANHVDKSLMRNTLAMEISSLLDNMCFVPTSHLVDVFLNGKYVGVYSVCEQVEIHKGRIEAEKNGTEVDTDYLIEFGGERKDTSFGNNIISTSLCNWLQVKSPDNEHITKEQYDFIKNYLKQIDSAVKAGEGYEELLDVDSLIDWFIMDELSYNLDCSFRRSVFLLKKAGGKMYFAAPWDFDYAFGNFSLDDYSYTGWICLGNQKTDDYEEYIKTNWMDYLLKDEAFLARLQARWNEIGEALLEKGLATIDYLEALCAPSAEENFKVWKNVLGSKIQYESSGTRYLATYAEQVDYLRTFLRNRWNWINNELKETGDGSQSPAV